MSQTIAKPVSAFPATIVSTVKAATLEFFTTSCRMPATEQAAPDGAMASSIMGVISFFGDPVWSFALVLPEKTAVTAANSFAGFDIPFDSPDMGDMVGEIVNVIAGDIVARLDACRVKAQMTLPTVARGHDVELLPPSNVCEARFQYNSSTGGFQVRLFQAMLGTPAGAPR